MEVEMTDFFEFKDRKHIVYLIDCEPYIRLKPLVDQIGLDWRSQKRAVFGTHSTLLYSPIRIEPPENGQEGGTRTPQTAVFIRLKRVHLWLCNLSLGNISAKGNPEVVAHLISLQQEWGDALYDYEHKGAAIKQAHDDAFRKDARLYRDLILAKSKTASKPERAALIAMIKFLGKKLGVAVQSDLVDEAA